MEAIAVAVIGLLGLLGTAAINAFVLYKISSLSRDVGTVRVDVGTVKSEVEHVKVATNSMKDELVRMARAEGKQEGMDEAAVATAKTIVDVAVGRALEKESTPVPLSAGDAIRGAIPVTVVDESVPVHDKKPTKVVEEEDKTKSGGKK